jgi:hypothetical protein
VFIFISDLHGFEDDDVIARRPPTTMTAEFRGVTNGYNATACRGAKRR